MDGSRSHGIYTHNSILCISKRAYILLVATEWKKRISCWLGSVRGKGTYRMSTLVCGTKIYSEVSKQENWCAQIS